jgi:hypothetical protein
MTLHCKKLTVTCTGKQCNLKQNSLFYKTLPVLHECATWSLTLREGRRLRVIYSSSSSSSTNKMRTTILKLIYIYNDLPYVSAKHVAIFHCILSL